MAKRYCLITQEQMEKFLFARGFTRISLPNTTELVYAKIVTLQKLKVSLRIYSSINPNGFGRKLGQDCIRVQLWWKHEETPVAASAAIRVLRVESWRYNLAKALVKIEAGFRTCPACGSPLVPREGKLGNFWACSTWHQTKCSGKAAVTQT